MYTAVYTDMAERTLSAPDAFDSTTHARAAPWVDTKSNAVGSTLLEPSDALHTTLTKLEAILHAATPVYEDLQRKQRQQQTHQDQHHVTFYTDSAETYEECRRSSSCFTSSSTGPRKGTIQSLNTTFQTLAETLGVRARVSWVPAHSGIAGDD
ncbi:hypothetical protein IscW_ISCW006757 [Ixodes scapularis]|uniref:RNase H type-1 domain-containing protein n=1 Tax=Ixodes scapularis TaxID=6945 RepID=B7PN41_IXOSC|nr:hypothetical protein IscW_ISCW006757 [Ixodes scapularis]|eukprot:XP_002435189.1 hypothetical protein IscW_ISCW006757 [Ixodes scapularis]